MKRSAALCLCLLPATASAEWVRAAGTYLFPPLMPETEACHYADERARADAILQVAGETVFSEDTLRCTEQDDEAECTRNATTWSMVDGHIREVRGRTSRTTTAVAGHRECAVTFEADVRTARERPDPGFTLGVVVNQPVFRDGETLTLALTPSQRMAVQVFQWLPYRRDDRSISRIFPNALDIAPLIDAPATIPTENGAKHYAIRVAFPQGMPPGRQMVDEYLVVIATAQPFPSQEAYSLDDFRRLLAELPRAQSRIVRKSYNVVRGTP